MQRLFMITFKDIVTERTYQAEFYSKAENVAQLRDEFYRYMSEKKYKYLFSNLSEVLRNVTE